MYFYEVIEKCDIEEAVRCFLKMCVNSPDIEHTEQCVRHAITDIKAIEAVKSDSEVIQIERVKTDEEEYDAVHMFDEASDTNTGWRSIRGNTRLDIPSMRRACPNMDMRNLFLLFYGK